MKLYTEEQVRESFKSGFRLAMETDGGLKEGQEEYINSLTPIELPSDEEIKKESHNYFMRGQLGFEAAADTERAFLRGVLWMRDKILNK